MEFDTKYYTVADMVENKLDAVLTKILSQRIAPYQCCGGAAENSTGRVLNAREVELPIMSYEDRCGQYEDGTLRPGMLCAGYADGNHDTCQVYETTLLDNAARAGFNTKIILCLIEEAN